jgi:chromosome segregation ATPase
MWKSLLDWMGWEKLSETNNRWERLDKRMATIDERLAAIEGSIDEAGGEITLELAKLREQLGNVITPEAEATIARLETKAKALADIIPNAPPPA